MILLDERDCLDQEFKNQSFDIFDFYEGRKVLNMQNFCSLELRRRNEILVVDTQTVLNYPELLENFKSVLNTYLGAIFFYEIENKKAEEWIISQSHYLSKIIGTNKLPLDKASWIILGNQLQFFWGLIEDQKNLQKHLMQFSLELDQVLRNAQEEMIKAKKIHEALIPRRKEEIKGISFTTKYTAGNGGGGEIYDLIQANSKVYQILLSSESYLMTSAVLGVLEHHKQKTFNAISFIQDVEAEMEVINSAKKKKVDTDLCILELDLSTLQLKSLTESKVELFSRSLGSNKLSKGEELRLEKGDKVLIFSYGFTFNWQERMGGKNLFEFVESKLNLSVNELVSELFFQLRDTNNGDILDKDATMVMMEVNRHGIHKV